ncbi:CPBP family intramembrane glutamic endopeptidase [Kandleria vitulina]|uniref:CPBP family intramembrane glutamic endopeptidase n=1 Tax=Kandleria vitulina TaxID=1630 RepID=UPI000691386B|nr:CPBP family intramembrane glutamic endopeptidase [Kandleria vitulina]
MNDYLKKDYALLTSLTISVITSCILLLLMITFSIIPVKTKEISMLITLTLPTIISLYLLPKSLSKFLIKNKNISIKEIIFTITFLLVFSIIYGLLFINKFDSLSMMIIIILHYSIVSLGEEYTYRTLILDVLKQKYKVWISIAISALLFSFILHINEDILINLLIRFPIGLILGYISNKTNTIMYSIILHTIYNLMIFIY